MLDHERPLDPSWPTDPTLSTTGTTGVDRPPTSVPPTNPSQKRKEGNSNPEKGSRRCREGRRVTLRLALTVTENGKSSEVCTPNPGTDPLRSPPTWNGSLSVTVKGGRVESQVVSGSPAWRTGGPPSAGFTVQSVVGWVGDSGSPNADGVAETDGRDGTRPSGDRDTDRRRP